MLRAASLSALLLATCAATAADPKPPVYLEATVVPPRPKGWGPFLRVRLVGAGKDASVITEGLTQRLTQAGKTSTVTLAFEERKDETGRLIVPSASKLGVVTLQPGEVAGVDVSNTSNLVKVLEAAAAGEVELVVEYEVPEAWAKRFGVVGGKVRGTAAVPKGAAPAAAKEAKEDLTGTWVGKTAKNAEVDGGFNGTWVFGDGKMTWISDVKAEKGEACKYSARAWAGEASGLDLIYSNGQVLKAIYKIEKGTLTVCMPKSFDTDGKTRRPTDFDARNRDDVLVVTFERKAP